MVTNQQTLNAMRTPKIPRDMMLQLLQACSLSHGDCENCQSKRQCTFWWDRIVNKLGFDCCFKGREMSNRDSIKASLEYENSLLILAKSGNF
jgi:hypothetical protein